MVALVLWTGQTRGQGYDDLNPKGKIHIPIGIANSRDTLKTFVEAEGNFSPGFGTYGIYFWVSHEGKLYAPTMPDVKCEHGLSPEGFVIPWSSWMAGPIGVRTEICEVQKNTPLGTNYLVGVKVTLTNQTASEESVNLFAALRPLGAAGWAVKKLEVSEDERALMADGHPALVASQETSDTGVSATDSVGEMARKNETPDESEAQSEQGNCSGSLSFESDLAPHTSANFYFVCPVLAGRKAAGHHWDGKSKWAQFDEAELNVDPSGLSIPDAGLEFYEKISAPQLFRDAFYYFQNLAGQVKLQLPEQQWAQCFTAALCHLAINMNDDAPDVAVANYNVFNRDGAYMVNIFDKAGAPELAARALSYFFAHPFNGRVQPEADNPGQILWAAAEHFRLTGDEGWLRKNYPSVQKLVRLISYYRTSPGPYWVSENSLAFGPDVPLHERKELKPGACDGFHPEYTEAFDVAGVRAAAQLALAVKKNEDAGPWSDLAGKLFDEYDQKFGTNLANAYGSYCVLWPCRLYSLTEGKAFDQFHGIGAQEPSSWRYFPLARAHQGLLTGNNLAGSDTLAIHLRHEQMRDWYAFDEGGRSGTGSWNKVRTIWTQGLDSVAMPHGWAMAELELLLRDCLVFEDGSDLVLLGGIPAGWFLSVKGISIQNLPTYFGKLNLNYLYKNGVGHIDLSKSRAIPDQYRLKLPTGLAVKLKADGAPLDSTAAGVFLIPGKTRGIELLFQSTLP